VQTLFGRDRLPGSVGLHTRQERVLQPDGASGEARDDKRQEPGRGYESELIIGVGVACRSGMSVDLSSSDQILLDEDYPPHEQLPRRAEFTFTLTDTPDGRKVSRMVCDGVQVGDAITDASRIEDGYCFHDAFHLAHAAVLGWSPVLRALMKRKRRSDPKVDEAEDGGRAIVVEEGISALVFAYASEHHYLDGKTHIDTPLLDTIRLLVAQLEVSVHRTADWEKAILTGYAAWRQLHQQRGGIVDLDMTTQTLSVRPFGT